MTTPVRAIYENGHLRLLDPVELEEGQAITVQIVEAVSEPTVPRRRVAGLHEGSIWMSEDFDAELPDEFWTESKRKSETKNLH